MKSFIQRILQKILGFGRYLWYFTLYKIATLKKDKNENDFFYFLKIIPNSATVLDIGANLGLMSYYLAKAGHQVHAFEPIPLNFTVLTRVKNKYAFNNLHLHNIALGNKPGKIELVLPVVKGVRKQGLSHVRSEKMTEFNEGDIHTSQVHTLDEYVKTHNLDVDAIKIDVENFEFEVFQGGIEMLKKYKPIVYCELWDNQNRRDCFKFMQSLEYEIKVLENDNLVSFQPEKSTTQNFFFIHPHH